MQATIPKGNIGYDQYTVPDVCSCRTYFCCFPLALENTFPWPFVPILSNFFEQRRTQKHPQYLLGLSRALFPTTFLETADYLCITMNKSILSDSFHLLSVDKNLKQFFFHRPTDRLNDFQVSGTKRTALKFFCILHRSGMCYRKTRKQG